MLNDAQENLVREAADRSLSGPSHDSTSLSYNPLDLGEILAGFSENIRRQSGLASAEECSFRHNIEAYNFRQSDGSVCKPAVKRTRKARVAKELVAKTTPKAKTIRAPRVKLVKEAKIKAPRKVPVTVTGRAISAYTAQTPAKLNERQTDPSITRYLTPASHSYSIPTPSTQHSSRPSTLKKNRLGAFNGTHSVLLSPRSARRLFDTQRILYRKLEYSSHPEPSPLGPSSLISLTRGLWQAGNRDQAGKTTDGGPREITSNQEALRVDTFTPLVNLTMLSVRKPSDITVVEEASDNSDTQKYTRQISEVSSDSSTDGFDTALGTQAYLDQLVAEPDDLSDHENFPQMECLHDFVPVLQSMQSLRESLNSSLESDLESRTHEGLGKRIFDEHCGSPRNVAAKTQKESSPHGHHPSIISLDSSQETKSAKHDYRAVSNLADSEAQQISGRAGHAPNIIEISNSDEEDNQSSKSEVDQALIVAARRAPISLSIEKEHQISSISRDTSLAEPSQQRSNLRKNDPKDSSSSCRPQQQTPSVCQARPVILDEDDYWVVPDSEDEAYDAPSKSKNAVARDFTVQPLPYFRGYTTARLQSELSTFGFKVGKNREGMIGLLNKCWEAKMRSGPQVTQVRTASNSTYSASNTSVDVVENEIEPSVPTVKQVKKGRESAADKAARMSAERVAKAERKALVAQEKAAKKLADTEAKKSKKLADKLAAEEAKVQNTEVLYHSLSQLLRSAEGLPWWQRMLKYEPIVLEDFRDWLLEKHFIEADVDIIRDYFDSKGVCCVKKITRTGKDRKRF